MSFATITLCVASQRVFVVVDFVIDSVRKLLDIPSYQRFGGPSYPLLSARSEWGLGVKTECVIQSVLASVHLVWWGRGLMIIF
jgi:hypothetical protein